MNINEEEEIKKEFQLERVILFSDAVFAIIITIMVLEIKLPDNLRHANPEVVQEAFKELIPKFIGYAFSFSLIGSFWFRHLQIFSFLKNYNAVLIILNLAFLFCVSMFPFAVTFITVGLEYTWGLFTYIGIIFLVTLSQTIITHYLIKNKALLCINSRNMETVLKWKVQRLNYAIVPIGFIWMAIISYFKLDPKSLLYFVGFYGVLVSLLNRKYYPGQNSSKPMIFKYVKSHKRKGKPQPAKKIQPEN
ncbi:MAG: hypothetical protein JWR38_721 [Mucilaginibacter sp.]|nr:hypothetical protein [Mucilaginibacter sp.]